MNALVIGKGGREHAIVRALFNSLSITQVHAIPGSQGMSREAVCHDLATDNVTGIVDLCKRFEITFAVIGPEAELAAGLADQLNEAGIPTVGPGGQAARLESSKVFAKEFMESAGVPTAKFELVNSVDSCMKAVDGFTAPYVLKADGLAAGKGVFICADKSELETAAKELFESKKLGAAGDQALLEQFAPGWELSFLVLTNGEKFEALPLMQDHKRLGEGDSGPNTGGMGTVGPFDIDKALYQKIVEEIVSPSVQELSKQKLDFRGVLYIGVMVTEAGPLVLEYNVRLGDPEAQTILPLLEGDWGQVFHKLSQNKLQSLNWRTGVAACVVLAAENYPENPVKGVAIEGDLSEHSATSYFLHAGTTRNDDGQWLTNGGRVVNAIGLGENSKQALANAYEQAAHINWPGMQMRKDIGHKL